MSTRIDLRAASLAGLLLTCDPAVGQDDLAERLRTPESIFTLSVGYLDEDTQRFGQYTGLREEGYYGILDVDFVNREDSTGTWFQAAGRNIGLDHAEAGVEWSRQGEWGLIASFSEIPRFHPYIDSTALAGIDGHDLTIGGDALRDAQLETDREVLGLAAHRWFSRNFNVAVSFRQDEKDGTRQFARGTPGAMEFLAEPVDHTMRQMEATIGYAGTRLQLAGGYYGTMFDNDDSALDVIGGAAALAGGANPFTPIGLPPDNRAHQVYLTGGYSFTQATRSTFKAAYTRQTQDDDFILPSTTGRTDLGGRLDVLLLQAGVTARPLPRLSVLANLRYEDRDDKTPIAQYFTGATPTSTSNGENEPRSIRTGAAKLEASYPLPGQLRLSAGVDYEEKTRSVSPVRVVSFRDDTRELAYRAELRRSLSAYLTGALSLVRSERDGSPFLTTVLNNGAPGSNLVAPLHLADRDRDKVRLSLDWTPLDALSLQILGDHADDDYSGRVFGLTSGRATSWSLDASYVLAENWRTTAYFSRGDARAEQLTQANAPTGQIWSAELRNRDDAWGLEARGHAHARLEVGAGVQRFEYRDRHGMVAVTGAPIMPLPDIETRQTTFDFFAAYSLRPDTIIRLDFIRDQWRTDDWTWTTWVYTDGTRVLQDPDQKTNFIALSLQRSVW